MQSRNPAFENSLRCLAQPVTVICILVLLVNDHYLKIWHPSWLTGKLSDFAGLYFFPFIVAAAFGVIFGRTCSRYQIGLASFLFVAIWFGLLKTFPPMHQATVQFISAIVGHPVQIWMDWTDVVALVALAPAWAEWNRPAELKHRRNSYAALALGLTACLATAPRPPDVTFVTHLWVKDGLLYATDAVATNTSAYSMDAGSTWERIDEPEIPLRRELKALPITTCRGVKPSECYRITGDPLVEISTDGGASWEIAWQTPVDRILFIARNDPDLDMKSYDLLILQWESAEYVLVGMGDEGLLRKQLPDGEWERITVRYAAPTHYGASDPLQAAFIMWQEMAIWSALSIIALLLAAWVIWKAVSERLRESLPIWSWVFVPGLSPLYGLVAAVVLVVATLAVINLIDSLIDLSHSFVRFEPLLFVVLFAAWPAIIIWAMKRWKALLLQHVSAAGAQSLVEGAYAMHLCVLLIASAPWLLWGMNVISNYWVATTAAVGITIAIAATFIRHLRKVAMRAALEAPR